MIWNATLKSFQNINTLEIPERLVAGQRLGFTGGPSSVSELYILPFSGAAKVKANRKPWEAVKEKLWSRFEVEAGKVGLKVSGLKTAATIESGAVSIITLIAGPELEFTSEDAETPEAKDRMLFNDPVGGAAFKLKENQTVAFIYDKTSERWRKLWGPS